MSAINQSEQEHSKEGTDRRKRLYTIVLIFTAAVYSISGITSHLNDATLNDGIEYRWYVSLTVLAAVPLLRYTRWGEANAERIFKVLSLLFTAHVIGMNYVNGFQFQYVLALFSTVWGVGIIIEDLRFITIYYVLMLFGFGTLIFYIPEMATDRMELLQNFVIAQVLAYLVTYNKIRNHLRTLRYLDRIRALGNDLEKKNKALDEAYSDTQSSIRYASGIQRYILPGEKVLQQKLKSCYVVFEPRDVVSGDFYWVKERGDDVWFGVADCTGHGVPGAFISLLAYTALDRSFDMASERGPACMLHEANMYLRQMFALSGQEHTNEGMDMALCKLSRSSGQLTFAGSRRPLLLARADGELVEQKGDRMSIGMRDSEMHSFTDHHLTVHDGDMVYLFSDGLVDQFGGEHDRKFGMARMREFVRQHHLTHLTEQKKALHATYAQWRQSTTQIDDICVLGIRV
jgi:serine phosphatase RsbU (regulator of sigma subunit)